ncbi:MAG TPA: aldolase/citrate lyase family protein [Stellaceae bacterium]|nr:aldolase/citrate lyase family protein [Stellaceae bacterium]
MRENRVKQIWAAGGSVLNGWCAIPSGFAAETMAHLGWDSLVIDAQHGLVGYESMVAMLQGISTTAVTPMVRVPWNAPAEIMKALDAGAYGIICPMVNSRAECEAFVGACRYAPRGYRSSGPVRAMLYGGSDYTAKANDTIVAMAMIETREALQNLDAIVSTPELDAVYVGPSDLSVSLGFAHGLDRKEDEVMAALHAVIAACRRHHIKAGIHTGATGYAKRMIEMGFDFVTVLSDARLMVMAGTETVREMRAAAPKRA